MTNRSPARRLILAVVRSPLSLSAIVAALLGPAQTLAQTHKPACQSSAHAKKRTAHTCTQPSHKVKAQARHAAKRHAKRTQQARRPPRRRSRRSGGRGAVRRRQRAGAGRDGSFSCDDGSEPECEDGATPTSSRNGKSLLCPVAAEGEASAAKPKPNAKKKTPGCTPGASSDDEQACEAAAGGSSSFVCEDES